ncbi:MAG: phosphate starvation-inducible protein PsiF [Methylocystaceae bacterium]|nr:MAG: phosphate starvation-inducible protein PsiF [Methylocystaceae bacterium]
MTIKSVMSITIAALGFGASAALAQSWAPPAEIAPAEPAAVAVAPEPDAGAKSAAKPAPTAVAAEKPASSAEEKKAKSKDCTAQADAKGLHGKERKKFRDQCKKA